MSAEGFSSFAVCSAAGISYRQLGHWDAIDLVSPSVAEAAGSGTPRRYSSEDVFLLRVVRELRDAGLELDAVRSVLGKMLGLADRWQVQRTPFVAVSVDLAGLRAEVERALDLVRAA